MKEVADAHHRTKTHFTMTDAPIMGVISRRHLTNTPPIWRRSPETGLTWREDLAPASQLPKPPCTRWGSGKTSCGSLAGAGLSPVHTCLCCVDQKQCVLSRHSPGLAASASTVSPIRFDHSGGALEVHGRKPNELGLTLFLSSYRPPSAAPTIRTFSRCDSLFIRPGRSLRTSYFGQRSSRRRQPIRSPIIFPRRRNRVA